MKKILLALSLGVAITAMAETDYTVTPVIRDIQNGVDNINAIEKLTVTGNTGTIGTHAIVTAVFTTDNDTATTSSPDFIGQLLVCSTNDGVWIGTNTTAGSWRVIK